MGDNNVNCDYGFIGGGSGNTVTLDYNAVLGGQNNNDSGLNGIMIAGNNIAAVIPDALHVNGLWAGGIPDGTTSGPYPAGTIFSLPFGVTPSWATFPSTNVLWVM